MQRSCLHTAVMALFLVITSSLRMTAATPDNLWFINSQWGNENDVPIQQLTKVSDNVFEGEFTPNVDNWPSGCGGYGVRFGVLSGGVISTFYHDSGWKSLNASLNYTYNLASSVNCYNAAYYAFSYDSENPVTYKAHVDFTKATPTVVFTAASTTEYSLDGGTTWTRMTSTFFRFDTSSSSGASLLFRVKVGGDAPTFYGFSNNSTYSTSISNYTLTSGASVSLSIPEGEYTYTVTIDDLGTPATATVTRTDPQPYVVQRLLNGIEYADGDFIFDPSQLLAFSAQMSKGDDVSYGLNVDASLQAGSFTLTPNATGKLTAPANAANYMYKLTLTPNAEDTEWTLVVETSDNPIIGLSSTLPSKLKLYGVNGGTYQPEEDLTMWYDGTSDDMLKKGSSATYCLDGYTMLLGNGQLGAELSNFLGSNGSGGLTRSVYINEKGLFGGGPTAGGNDNQYFEAMARLDITTFSNSTNPTSNTICQLDLAKGVASSIASTSAGHIEASEWLASFPDQVLVGHITANKSTLGFYFELNSLQSGSVAVSNGTATMSGTLGSGIVSYAVNMKIVVADGSVWTEGSKIGVDNSSEILIVISAATNYDPSESSQLNSNTTTQLESLVASRVNAAASKGWGNLYTSHVEDYSGLMNRMTLSIEGQTNDLETGSMLKNYHTSLSDGRKKMFDNLVFAYGRYCEIATSRPYNSAKGIGLDSPSNLMGIWTAGDHNWRCDIHANINVNMNYWPAEATNLSETHLGFCDWIIKEANLPLWKSMTNNYSFGHLASEQGWTAPTCINPFGGGDMYNSSVYNAAQAWMCAHLIQHYLYTLDQNYLNRALPVLWQACKYWQGNIKDTKTTPIATGYKRYVVGSEWSPEHGSASEGLPHAQQLVHYLFKNTIALSEQYGLPSNITQSELDDLKNMFADLDDGVHVNSGALEEWPGITPAADTHRHISHLMAMYPLATLHKGDDAFSAAEQSVIYRGAVGYGDTDLAVWTTAWKSCLWAQARDHRAYENFTHSFTLAYDNSHEYGLYPNLISMNHYPQIDGTFGNTACVAEMLLQSNRSDVVGSSPYSYVDVAPALPTEWAAGAVDGLKAQGNFEVGYKWSEGKVTEIRVKALASSPVPLYVHYDNLADGTYYVADTNGMSRDKDETIDKWDADHVWKFEAASAGSYVVIKLGDGDDVDPVVVSSAITYDTDASDADDVTLPTPNTGGIKILKDGEDVLMHLMFGTSDVKYFDASSFDEGGVSWTQGGRADASLEGDPSDFLGYAAPQPFKDGALAAPFTEMNGMMGADNTENGGMFLTPVSGDFLRLEPRYTGTVNLWLRQTAPLYIMDETGKVLEATCEGATGPESRADAADGAYVVASDNVKVKYSISVKGGKTYYVGSRDENMGFVAAEFVKGSYAAKSYTIETAGTVNSQSWPKTEGETANVTLNREFTKGYCHPIVLPFSVSESQMREIFGNDVLVAYLDPYDNSLSSDQYRSVYSCAVSDGCLALTLHYYQMLYANVPAFVMPSQSVSNPVFNEVTYEGNTIKSYALDADKHYWVTGSYFSTNANANGEMYYFNNTPGTPPVAAVYHASSGVDMKPTRSWIKVKSDYSPAPVLRTVENRSFTDDGAQTGIATIVIDGKQPDEDNAIYNLLGIPVNANAPLAPGIYISRGRKIVVK